MRPMPDRAGRCETFDHRPIPDRHRCGGQSIPVAEQFLPLCGGSLCTVAWPCHHLSFLLPEQDYFGVGWYQAGTSGQLNDITAGVLGLGAQGQGIEIYYRIQATKALQITPDIQIIDPARQGIDTAYLCGVRALLSF